MTPENEALLMKEVGAIGAKIDMMHENIKGIQPRITEVERKMNRQTGVLAAVGAVCLFFKDKVIGILSS